MGLLLLRVGGAGGHRAKRAGGQRVDIGAQAMQLLAHVVDGADGALMRPIRPVQDPLVGGAERRRQLALAAQERRDLAAERRRPRDLFERIAYPALMHCKSGADRAGLGAALYRILHLGHPVEAAMAELGWKYGHFKRAKTGVLDFFFATYVARNRQSPIGFLEWVDTEYNRLDMHNRFRAEGWASLIVDKVLHRE